MEYKIQYTDDTDRQGVLDANVNKTLIGEQNIYEDGVKNNYLVFVDKLPPVTSIEPTNQEINDNQMIIMEVLANMTEALKAKGGM